MQLETESGKLKSLKDMRGTVENREGQFTVTTPVKVRCSRKKKNIAASLRVHLIYRQCDPLHRSEPKRLETALVPWYVCAWNAFAVMRFCVAGIFARSTANHASAALIWLVCKESWLFKVAE